MKSHPVSELTRKREARQGLYHVQTFRLGKDWLSSAGNRRPLLGLKPAGDLIGSIYFRRSPLASV